MAGSGGRTGTGRLTHQKAKALKAPGYYAGGRNLYLQLTATGGKSWVCRYQLNGRIREMGLGSFADVSLARARELAEDARRLLREGIDPIEARRTERAARALARAFRDAAEDYVATHEASWRNKQHREQWRTTLKDYVYPELSDLAVNAITPADVRSVIEPLWKRTPATAQRVLGRIRMVIDAARADDDSAWSNPADWRRHKARLPKRPRPVHRAAMPYKDVPRFVARLRQHEGVSHRALEFLILTACRSGEVTGARWDELQTPERLWVIPPHRMKANQEHRVPLSLPALEWYAR